MENDHSCKIDGIGSIQIQMFCEKVLTLTNVEHISSMCKNLISLEEVDMRGKLLMESPQLKKVPTC